MFIGRRSSPGAPAPRFPSTQPEERLQKVPCQRLRLRSAGVSELEGVNAQRARPWGPRRIGSLSLLSPLLRPSGRKEPERPGSSSCAPGSSRCGGLMGQASFSTAALLADGVLFDLETACEQLFLFPF